MTITINITSDKTDNPVLGRDLRAAYNVTDGRYEDVDISIVNARKNGKIVSDTEAVEGINNALQAVIHRLKTRQGELTGLGHPNYGSRHHELIGEPNSANNRNLVKLYILRALAREPRIEKITQAVILYDRKRAPDRVEISLILQFIGSESPVNLVVPFSFIGAL
jgi:phage baseplate assembly protein W